MSEFQPENSLPAPHLTLLLAKLNSLSQLAADTQAVHRHPDGPLGDWIKSTTAAGYEVADYWSVTTRHAHRIVADIQLFLNLDTRRITVRMRIDMQRCQEEIRRDNYVSLANLVCFKKAVNWLFDIRDIRDKQAEWENVNTKLRKLIADTKAGLTRKRSVL